MRVLYVEDNEDNRRVVAAMLRAGQIEMAEAPDGKVGLQMIADNDYDLVLMDLRMPKMDGLTAIRHLRAQDGDKASLPVIVVTADTGPTIHQDCIAAGADDVVLKPLSIPLLYQAIGALLARRGDAGLMLA